MVRQGHGNDSRIEAMSSNDSLRVDLVPEHLSDHPWELGTGPSGLLEESGTQQLQLNLWEHFLYLRGSLQWNL